VVQARQHLRAPELAQRPDVPGARLPRGGGGPRPSPSSSTRPSSRDTQSLPRTPG
jgi:hypothetical protein